MCKDGKVCSDILATEREVSHSRGWRKAVYPNWQHSKPRIWSHSTKHYLADTKSLSLSLRNVFVMVLNCSNFEGGRTKCFQFIFCSVLTALHSAKCCFRCLNSEERFRLRVESKSFLLNWLQFKIEKRFSRYFLPYLLCCDCSSLPKWDWNQCDQIKIAKCL